MSVVNLGDRLIAWAQGERPIQAVVMIGSRVRAQNANDAADQYSDWDFQVVTSEPELFDRPVWLEAAGLGRPLAYARRTGRLGSAQKLTVVLSNGEIDLVIIPALQLRVARFMLVAGLANRVAGVERGLADLALVLRGGYRVVKGESAWGVFFQRVATQITTQRITDSEIRVIADGFVCDYVSTLRKIERGEMLAAQRWLHHQLAEANFRLLHELQQRAGALSYPDARRIEWFTDGQRRLLVEVSATPTAESLNRAVRKSADACRYLARELVGEDWRWPSEIG